VKQKKEVYKRTWRRGPQDRNLQSKKAWTLREYGGKPVWDWIQLLIVPALIPLAVAGFGIIQFASQQRAEDQRAQQSTLQAYFDQMSHLLLEKDLRNSEADNDVRTLARARTLTVLETLDSDRKGRLVQFLYEAGLINKEKPIIDLTGANAAEANLSGAVLNGADLSGADLSGAELSGAQLIEAKLGCDPPAIWSPRNSKSCTDLSDADLSDAILNGANLGCSQAPFGLMETKMDRTDCVDLRGADLSGTDLNAANLSGANLEDAIPRKQLVALLGNSVDIIHSGRGQDEVRGGGGRDLIYVGNAPVSVEGATLPNGQKMPLGLPEKLPGSLPAQIPAGGYITDEFEPMFHFKVDESWQVPRSETQSELSIERSPEVMVGAELIFVTPRLVFDHPGTPSKVKEGCTSPPPWSDHNPDKVKVCPAPKNVDEWVSWFQNHPNLETSKPVPESVGSASGKRIDVTVTSAPENYAQDICGADPCVPLFPSDTSESNKRISYLNSKGRFVIVDVGGNTVVIDVAAPEDKFNTFLPSAQKILDTVEWKPNGQKYMDWLKREGLLTDTPEPSAAPQRDGFGYG